VEKEDITRKVIGCAYQAPRSGFVFQAALPERTDAVDPSNPVNPVRKKYFSLHLNINGDWRIIKED